MGVVGKIGDAVQIRKTVTIEWEIPDFFSLRNKVDDCYHSPTFIFDESQLYFKLCPGGESCHRYSGGPYVALYLMRNDDGPPKTIYFTLSIDELKSDEIEYQFSRENKGFHSTCKTSRLMKRMISTFPPKKVLRIKCELGNVHSTVKGVRKLQKSLLRMLESGEDSDVLFKVQGKEYPSHRSILRARSPVFHSMFSHNMVEKQSGVVSIEDCDPDTFHDFLVYMYSGSCKHICSKNVYSLYQAANKYDISELEVECVNFMKRNLTIASICDVIIFAVKYDKAELMTCATKYFCDNSLTIFKTNEWKTFLKENFTVGNELIIKALKVSQQVPINKLGNKFFRHFRSFKDIFVP